MSEQVPAVPYGDVRTRAGVVVDANAAFARLLDLEVVEVIGQPWDGFLRAGSRIYVQTHVLPVLAMQGRVDDVSIELERGDGVVVSVLAAALSVDDGEEVRWGLLPAPGRARFEAEVQRARRAAEAAGDRLALLRRLATALAGALDVAEVADATVSVLGRADGVGRGGVVWVPGSSDALVASAGAEHGGVPGGVPTSLDDLTDPVVRAFRGPGLVVDPACEVAAVPFGTGATPDGVVSIALPVVQPLLETDALTLRDADEPDEALSAPDALFLGMLAEHVGDALRRAQLYQHKDWLLGVAAHDLRSPLVSIRGAAELLPRILGDALGDREAALLHTIETAAVRMDDLIEDVLAVSSIQAGQLAITPSQVDMAELVSEVVAAHLSPATEKEISLRADVQATDTICHVDRRRVAQAIDNLVSNAVKYSAHGSAVTVAVLGTPDEVRVEVVDGGQGIPTDELPHVFVAFHRTSVRPTGGETSTGLGLSIVKSVIEAHGGNVDVTSAPGAGSTFGFTLPRGAPQDEAITDT